MKKILLFFLLFFGINVVSADYTQVYNNPSGTDIGQNGILFYHPDYISSSEAIAQKYCIDRGGTGYNSYNGNNNIINDIFLLVSNGSWLNVVGFGGTFNSITCNFTGSQDTTSANLLLDLGTTFATGGVSTAQTIVTDTPAGYILYIGFGLAFLSIMIGVYVWVMKKKNQIYDTYSDSSYGDMQKKYGIMNKWQRRKRKREMEKHNVKDKLGNYGPEWLIGYYGDKYGKYKNQKINRNSIQKIHKINKNSKYYNSNFN